MTFEPMRSASAREKSFHGSSSVSLQGGAQGGPQSIERKARLEVRKVPRTSGIVLKVA